MRRALICLLCLLFVGQVCTANAPFSASAPDVSSLVEQLNSPDYATRQAAQTQLLELDADQLGRLASVASTCPSAEAAVRCIDAITRHFRSQNADAVHAAWECLESLRSDDRQLVREQVSFVLTEEWRTRLKLSMDELQKLGVVVVHPEAVTAAMRVQRLRRMMKDRQQPIGGRQLFGTTAPSMVQLFFTNAWTGDLEALRLLRRVPGLQTQTADAFGGNGAPARRRFARFNGDDAPVVGIFLITGHSLDDTAVAWLKGAFGNDTHERPEVMLGINALAGVAGPGVGCKISNVVPFGSGDAAGLMSGDEILSVAEHSISSFNDLVDELHNYAPGDTVVLKVNRQNVLTPIPVTLRSWKDYAQAINDAAAEYRASLKKSSE